ncbi:MAG: hypothetical protein OHK0029_08740 [Armatimonadaceae bacterium]
MRNREMVFMFFTSGKSAADVPREQLMALQKAHIGNLERLYKEGVSPLAGPLSDPDKKRRGIVLLNIKHAHETPRHFESDPYVKQGYMKVEAYPVRVPVMDIGKPEESAIAEHTIALLQANEPVSDAVLREWEERLIRLPRSERPRLLVVRRDSREPLAMVALFVESDAAKVEAVLASIAPKEPKRGEWKVWKQWLSKGVLPA